MKDLINFFKSKWLFSKPEQKNILIYDKGNSEYFFKYFGKKKCAIYPVRWESINIYVLLSVIFSKGFFNIKKNYKLKYFFYVKPKLAITLIENNPSFYQLKYMFPNVTTIAIQNGVRNFQDFALLKKLKKYQPTCDFLLCYSERYGEIYKKYIRTKILTIGSFINNSIKLKLTNKKDFLFISKYKPNYNAPNEIIILKSLVKYSILKKIKKIDVSIRVPSFDDLYYFRENLTKQEFSKLRFILSKAGSSYKTMKDYKLIVFTDSTLGYECLARGKKVASFALGSLNSRWCIENHMRPLSKFGYPNKLPDAGNFWSNKFNYEIMNKTLNKILRSKNREWQKKNTRLFKKVMFFDPGNKLFRNLIKNKVTGT